MKEVIVIINRWEDEFVAYYKLANPNKNRVVFLTTEKGARALKQWGLSSCEAHICDLKDKSVLQTHLFKIQNRYGQIDRLLALSEYDLLLAASLREQNRIQGLRYHQAVYFKDKVLMKEKVEKSGLPVPRYRDNIDEASVDSLIQECGFPVVLKPVAGAASQGVFVVKNPNELKALLPQMVCADYECEEYVQGPIFHADGFCFDGKIHFVKISRYLNTCLDFSRGKPLGSITIPSSSKFYDRCERHVASVLKSLELNEGPFHLEFILRANEQPCFLEVGARVGGGEIPFVMRDALNCDLMRIWLEIELGLYSPQSIKVSPKIAGFVMVPEPREVPCQVLNAPSMKEHFHSLYREILPPSGMILEGKGGYQDISGRFHFCGDEFNQVYADISHVMGRFRLDYQTALGQAL